MVRARRVCVSSNYRYILHDSYKSALEDADVNPCQSADLGYHLKSTMPWQRAGHFLLGHRNLNNHKSVVVSSISVDLNQQLLVDGCFAFTSRMKTCVQTHTRRARHTHSSQTAVSGCQLGSCQQLQGRAAILNAGQSRAHSEQHPAFGFHLHMTPNAASKKEAERVPRSRE